MLTFNQFFTHLVVEELHPELKAVVADTSSNPKAKQDRLVQKIRELTSRGEATGVEHNMPKGSSRAFLFEQAPRDVTIDGTPAKLPVGTKVAIRSNLDKFHDKSKYMGKSLGELQQAIENNDPKVNKKHRILIKNDDNSYTTNTENGIFPPLVEHDVIHHQYSTVGQCSSLTRPMFSELTKTPEYPNGITHKDFTTSLARSYTKMIGSYWEKSPAMEAKLDKIAEHPLVKKFSNYGGYPYDYEQIKNLGVFTHPVTGEKHIVATDHGFNILGAQAYGAAINKQYNR